MNESKSETKFIFHTQLSSQNPSQANDKCEAMKKLQAISFALDDLRLFLDTHPFEMTAINSYETYRNERNQILSDYATNFGPIEPYNVKEDNQWTWVDSPWPWEGEV
jgi:spore coat protein JB